MFRWGIFGTGDISAKFVAGVADAPGATVALVASRDHTRAERFARAHGIARAVAGYNAAAIVGAVDAVYIATPTGLHATHAIACLEAGIPVLIEKPFAATATEANAIVAAAVSRGLFVMEGLWTRCLPAVRALADRVAAGAIGTPHLITGGFAIANAEDAGRPLFQPGLAGGALRQYGIYPLALGQMIAGPAIEIRAAGTRGSTGVETSVALSVRYATGVIGSFHASLETTAENGFTVHGSSGRLAITGPVYRPAGLRFARFIPRRDEGAARPGLAARLRASAPGNRIAQFVQHRRGSAGTAIAIPHTGNGYNFEAVEAMRCIRAGCIESPLMPHADSVELARLIDAGLEQIRLAA